MTDGVPVGISEGWKDPTYAFRLREALRQVAKEEYEKMSPSARVGRAMSFDLGNMTCSVWFPGDPEPITVSMFPGVVPNDTDAMRKVEGLVPTSARGPGALVVVERIHSKDYITYVLSGGNFAYKLQTAGQQSKVFNVWYNNPEDSFYNNALPPVKSVMSSQMTFFLPSFTEYGAADVVGPFVGMDDGAFLDGIIRIMVSQYSEARYFEFTLSNSLFGYALRNLTSDGTLWYRLVPVKSSHWGGTYDLDIRVDIGIRPTGILDKTTGGYEFWLRFSPGVPDDFVDFTWVHIDGIGPFTNFGEPGTGRILAEIQDPITPISGFIGFHEATTTLDGAAGGVLRTREDETLFGANPPIYPGSAWNSGPMRDSALRTAKDLAPLWSCTGPFTWNGSGLGWSGDIVLTGVGPNMFGLFQGRLNIPMPPDGTRIPIYPSTWGGSIGTVTVQVASGRIPVAAGQTLYLVVPPAAGNTVAGENDWFQKKYLFFLVDNETYTGHEHNFKLPEYAIPIFHRSYTLSQHPNVWLTSPQAELINSLEFQALGSTALITPAVTTGETAVFTFGTHWWRQNIVYRLKVKLHVAVAATTQSTIIRVRRAAGTGGTLWHTFGNIGGTSTGAQFPHYLEQYFYNPGADLGLQFTVTASNTVAGPTLPAGAHRYAEIEYAGPLSKYSSAAIAIT